MICTDAWELALWLRCRHGCPWGARSFLIGHFGTELLLSSASPWGRHAALIRSRLCLCRCVSEQIIPLCMGRRPWVWAPHAVCCGAGVPVGRDAQGPLPPGASVAPAGSLRHWGPVQVSWRSSVAFVVSADRVFKFPKAAACTAVRGRAVSPEDVMSRAVSSFLSVVLLFSRT